MKGERSSHARAARLKLGLFQQQNVQPHRRLAPFELHKAQIARDLQDLALREFRMWRNGEKLLFDRNFPANVGVMVFADIQKHAPPFWVVSSDCQIFSGHCH
ncbi:MAG: hypothetical protein H6875_02855 [Hyphomicrobiaceae bacterium]|nr:hypothetical protein [Hyphomicrobiaceae bacterium]